MNKIFLGLIFATLSYGSSVGIFPSAGGGTGNVTDINSDVTASQTLTTGTTGTDFAIVDNASGDHKFNLPDASATARGVITTGAQTVAGVKTFSSAPIFSTLTASNVVLTDGSKALTSLAYASANTNNAIVSRDGSGNFAAGTITAALTGNASTATALAANPAACGAGEFVTDIAANGTLTCATPAGGSGVTTVGTFSGSSIADGASISSTTITFGPADGTNPGMVTTGAQTIAGAKTLTGVLTVTAGAVGAPSINFGDANTGIYATAVDTIDFSTAGTRRWTIDSSGHLTNNSGGTRVDFGGSNYISASGANVNFYGGNANLVTASNLGLLMRDGGVYSTSDGAAQSVFTTVGRVSAYNSTSAIKRFHSIDASNRLRVGGTGTNGILYGGALSVTAPADYGYNNMLTYSGASTSTPTIVATALASGVAFQFGIGDYLNLDGGTNRRITGISGNVVTLDGAVGDSSLHTVYVRYPIASMRDRNGDEKFFIDPDGETYITNSLTLTTAGSGLRIKEGSNATSGVATLVAGTVTVSTTKVTANSRIQLTPNTLGTVTVPQAVGVTARSAGTSFTITSADATDTSDIAWVIIENAP